MKEKTLQPHIWTFYSGISFLSVLFSAIVFNGLRYEAVKNQKLKKLLKLDTRLQANINETIYSYQILKS